jgi:predicted HTH transcriptional regulator
VNRKPFDIYSADDWSYLTQPRVEGQWFERKGHPPTRTATNLREFREKIAHTICGFANNNPDVGGLFVVGIGDAGELYGIDPHGPDYLNKILSYDELLDGPIAHHKIIECQHPDGRSDHLVFIYTRFLPQRVARMTNGDCYSRQGDRTIILRPDQAQMLAYHKGELHFEDEPAILFDETELEPGVVNEFLDQYARKKRLSGVLPIADALRQIRLAAAKDGQVWLTKGGALIFYKDPRTVIPGAYVRYFRYEGRDKDSPLIRDELFDGPLPIVIQKLREFLPTQFSRFSFRTAAGGLTSENEYPSQAWDEALVNAIVHRSYSQQTRPVRIDHFDDRVEVTSPGSYPLGVTPDNFIHTPRNTNTMDTLRYLDFVQMAEEGTKTMRQAMLNAGLPAPQFSPPELADRVICTLFNNIDERIRARSTQGEQGQEGATSIATNMYPLHIRAPLETDPDAPFAEEGERPTYQDIRQALTNALQQVGFRIDSFTQSVAVDFAAEYQIPALTRSKIASIYPGFEFQIREFGQGSYLLLDHTVRVRNRLTADQVRQALPALHLDGRRRCFVRGDQNWLPGFIVEIVGNVYRVELRGDDHDNPDIIEVTSQGVIPELKTTEIAAILEVRKIPVQLHQEVRRASLVSVKDAPRARLDRVREIVDTLSERVFPLVIGAYEIQLATKPTPINRGSFRLGRKLSDPKAQFDDAGLRQEDDIVQGLTSYGAFEKPKTEVPLVIVSPARWADKMDAFIRRLRQGHQRYRGMETTFGLRLGSVTTVISEFADYEAKIAEVLARLPADAFPIFIVLAPEAEANRVDYNAPYYRVKRLLLESGYPSQMVDEDTLTNPDWKDLNFALDVFAKAGYVPWVLSGEGMPKVDLFVGLSSSIIAHQGQRHRLVGYANVFDEYGRWLFYEGASTSVRYEERNEMFADLLGKITRSYRAKRRKPNWIHVHHSAKLSRVDRDEIARGVLQESPDAEISFVYINEHSTFRLFNTSPRGDGAVERGTWLTLSSNSFLVSTIGPNSIGQRYMGTPRPLEVRVNRVHERGQLDLALYAQHVLSLTRLNWASSRSFCHTPITIKFANNIAYLMNVFLATGKPFQLHERLQSTPWFL